MATPLLLKREVLLAKVESTYGTDPTPGPTTDAFPAIDLDFKETAPPGDRPIRKEALSRQQRYLGERYAELTFKIEILGSGSVALPPRVGALLRGCSFTETINSGVSVVYTPNASTATQESVTFYFYRGGRLHKITGAVGTIKGVCEAGKLGILELSFMGLYNAPTLASIPTTAVYDTTAGVCKGGTLSYNSKTTLVGNMFDFDTQNTIAKRPSLSASDAIAGFYVSDRDPIATFNPEMTVETSYDFRGDALTNERALSYTVGSYLTISCPAFNPYYPEYNDVEGILHEKIQGQCDESSGNDEITLTFTG